MREHMIKRLEDQTKPVTLREAEVALSNDVYAAAILFERFEGKKLLHGNGHHMAQQVAEFAQELLRKQWTGPK